MKLTLTQLVVARPVLETLRRMKLKSGVSFWLGRQNKKIFAVLEDYDQAEVELIKTHGTLNPATNQYEVPRMIPADGQAVSNPAWELVTNGLNELLRQDVELDLETRPIDFLGEAVELTPDQMMAIEFLFDPEPEPGSKPRA